MGVLQTFEMADQKVEAVTVTAVAAPAAGVASGNPPGTTPGGQWINQQHCGVVTILIGIFFAPCVCCCPCDSISVYQDPNGNKFLPTGAPYEKCCCQCVE